MFSPLHLQTPEGSKVGMLKMPSTYSSTTPSKLTDFFDQLSPKNTGKKDSVLNLSSYSHGLILRLNALQLESTTSKIYDRSQVSQEKSLSTTKKWHFLQTPTAQQYRKRLKSIAKEFNVPFVRVIQIEGLLRQKRDTGHNEVLIYATTADDARFNLIAPSDKPVPQIEFFDIHEFVASGQWCGRIYTVSNKTAVRFCRHCKVKDCRLLRCGRCFSAFYCSQDCQIADWSSHKTDCSLS